MAKELTSTLPSIHEFMVKVSRHLDQMKSSCQDQQSIGMVIDETTLPTSQTTQIPPPKVSNGALFCLSYHYQTILPPTTLVSQPIVLVVGDARLVEHDARVERLERKI